jgi:hypothetical protein
MLRINGCKYARYVAVCCIGYSRSDLRIERGMCGCSLRESSIALRAQHIGIRSVNQAYRFKFRPCPTLSTDSEHHAIRHTGVTACNTVAHWVCSTERNLNAGTFRKLHNFRVWSVWRAAVLHAFYFGDEFNSLLRVMHEPDWFLFDDD